MSQSHPPSESTREEYVPAYDQRQWLRDADTPEKYERFARQILETCGPYFSKAVSDLDALDVGSGNGWTTLQLAKRCRQVTGIELSRERVRRADQLKHERKQHNLQFHCQSVYDLSQQDAYDLVVLDNVLEHLPDQAGALRILQRVLRPGGVLFLLTPNKLWPMEVHYRLPLLSYLPLSWANAYLRITGRGEDYTDCSYCPTYFGLKRLLRRHTTLNYHFVTPANVRLAAGGARWHYRLGVAAIQRFPLLWCISKALLVVAVHPTGECPPE